jgi:aryl-alcohol dehydrogenase-like predicted oxidoreductase
MLNPPFSNQPLSGYSPHPRIWLGTWVLGGQHFGKSNYQESQRVINTAFKLGIRHFDTAYLYSKGASDRLLHPLCQHHRSSIYISAKVGLHWSHNTVVKDASPNRIRKTLTDSLSEMKTDYLDLLIYHYPDPHFPLCQVIDAFKCLQSEGLIRYYGVSNLTTALPIPHQIHYNPIHRDPLPPSGYTMAYSPLEQGLLSGIERHLGKKDIRRHNRYFINSNVQQFIQTLCQYTDDVPGAVYRWLRHQTQLDALLLGPRSVDQLRHIWRCIHHPDPLLPHLNTLLNNGPFNSI